MNLLHGLSIDVEEWFHILECDGSPQPIDWECLQSRVFPSTIRLLDFLAHHRIHATFFFLGWVAERYPELVKEVVIRGHEIGSHSHMHLMVSRQMPDEFARDLDKSIEAISRAANCNIHAYRAPGFSITRHELWAFEILASRGIYLDSSLFLSSHSHGGCKIRRNRPFELILSSGRRIIEMPVVPCPILGWSLPFSGGGYLRLIPIPLLKLFFKRVSEYYKAPIITYLHSRDFDPEQPRMALPYMRYFKYYVGVKTTPFKLEQLFKTFHFTTLGNIATKTHLDRPLHISSF